MLCDTQLFGPAMADGDHHRHYPYLNVPLSFFPAADKKEEAVSCSPVVIPVPSKRGRKKKSTIPLVGSATGADTMMLSHLAGQVHVKDIP